MTAFAERLSPAWTKLSAQADAPVPVLFTAHSVPIRTVQASEGQLADPYTEQARRTAALVAERLPEIPQCFFAFQSQGASGGPWLGPTVERTLEAIAHSGAKTVLIQMSRESGTLSVDVEDDGKGFTPADVATPSETGQGLGLLGMRERIEILGGTLTLDSSPGAGTHVAFTVPVPKEEPPGWHASGS